MPQKQKKKKSKLLKILKILLKLLFHFLQWIIGLMGPLIFIPIIIAVIVSSYLVAINWFTEEPKKEVVKTVDEEVEDILLTAAQEKNSTLSPQPKDTLNCDNCNCKVIDYYINSEHKGDGIYEIKGTKKDTKRLWGDATGRESYKNKDWIYTGWTINTPGTKYFDVDFSKFSNREPENIEKEYLFQWNVNNYTSSGGQTILIEFLSNQKLNLDESTRNGSFITTSDAITRSHSDSKIKRESLDFNGYSIETEKGRIKTAIPAIAIFPTKSGIEKMGRARQLFHRDDVWGGDNGNNFKSSEISGLWNDAMSRGACVDVVFEDNNKNYQYVIPFTYRDVKDMHWKEGFSQFVDSRYGQVNGTIIPSYSGDTYTKVTTTYACILREIGPSIPSNYEVIDLYDINLLTYGTANYGLEVEDIVKEKVLTNLTEGEEYFKNKVILGWDEEELKNTYFTFNNFRETDLQETKDKLTDDAELRYSYMSSLEIINIFHEGQINVNNVNRILEHSILKGTRFEGKSFSTKTNQALIGMRIYYDTLIDNIDFTAISKSFDKCSESDLLGNKVIEYCDETCKCNICLNIAR